MAVRAQEPGRAVNGHSSLGAVPGRYWRKPAGRNWPSVTPPTMTRDRAVVATAVWRMMPPRPTPMTATRLTADGTEDQGLQYAGVAERHLEVLCGEDSLADFEADEIAYQCHGEDERRHDGRFGRQHEAPGGAWR